MISYLNLFWYLITLITSLFWAPILVLISVLNALLIKGQPFFMQERGGQGGQTFKIIKLKTMKDLANDVLEPLPDSERITKFGFFLRKTSLDELPCLINVLLGQMTVVGPRPFISEYLPLYSDEQKKRHLVLPGVTGWAQVNGRNAISWEEKFKYDIWYVDNQSFLLDVKIIWMTIKKVIALEGISADGEATMPKFTGNKE